MVRVLRKKSLSVVASPGEVGFKISVKKGDIVLGTKELQVSLDTSTGVLSYETADGTPLLREKKCGKTVYRL